MRCYQLRGHTLTCKASALFNSTVEAYLIRVSNDFICTSIGNFGSVTGEYAELCFFEKYS